jgi:hypothetical protein
MYKKKIIFNKVNIQIYGYILSPFNYYFFDRSLLEYIHSNPKKRIIAWQLIQL